MSEQLTPEQVVERAEFDAAILASGARDKRGMVASETLEEIVEMLRAGYPKVANRIPSLIGRIRYLETLVYDEPNPTQGYSKKKSFAPVKYSSRG